MWIHYSYGSRDISKHPNISTEMQQKISNIIMKGYSSSHDQVATDGYSRSLGYSTEMLTEGAGTCSVTMLQRKLVRERSDSKKNTKRTKQSLHFTS